MNTSQMKHHLVAMLGIILCGFISTAAEPTITADATSVTVNVPAGYAPNARLILAYGGGDRGTQFAAWPTTRELAASVPAEGGAYSVSLADLGFPDGNCTVRAFFESGFEKLDYLVVDAANDYLDPGLLDNEVYGIEFGYKPTGGSVYGKIICAIESEGGVGTPFRFEGANSTTRFNFCADTTAGVYQYKAASLSSSDMNTVVARNSAITVNGVKVGDYRTSPIGIRGSHVRLNTKNPDDSADRSFGWWYYLRIYGADDRLLVDYIPVRRTADDTVGFYDQAENRFVTPTGGGTYGAGSAVEDGAFAGICAVTPAVEVASRAIALTVAGNVATVTVPAGVATGEKLYLVSDEADRGLDVQAWHDVAVLSAAIPAEGGSFALTLTGFCTYSENVLRAFTTEDYTQLASLSATDANDYLDTGVTDALCYGFEYGYQPLNGSGQYGKTFAATNGIVRLERANGGNTPSYNYCFYNAAYSDQVYVKLTLDGNACNAIAFRNKTLTLNSASKLSAASAPIGKMGYMLRMNNKTGAAEDLDCGKWYYIRLFGRSGCKLIDYVPAKSANGTIGFLDLTSRTFVTPTGGGAYTSDNVEQGTVSRILRLTAPTDYEAQNIPVTAEWIGGASADLTVSANWRCRNVGGDVLDGVLPNRSATAVTVSGLFGFNVTNAANVCWRSIRLENAVLAADLDWSASFGAGDIEDGFSIDLAGHTLTVDELQGNGTITDTSANGGVLCLDVPEGVTVGNAGVLLTGSLKLLKTGAGSYRPTIQGATYTGGTVIEQGLVSMDSRAHPSGDGVTITICTNGVFDINAPADSWGYIWTDCTLILAGGRLENRGSSMNTQCRNLGTVRLTENSTMYAKSQFGFVSQGYAPTLLDLGEHELELQANSNFHFYNTTITNGTLNITAGGWIIFGGLDGAVVDASTASIEFHESPRWNVQKDLLVSNLVMRATDDGSTINGAAKVKIFGTFTPHTDYIHNYELQEGSTLDLSVRSTVYPMVNPKKSNYKVTCAADATRVTVDLGNRSVRSGQQILSWPSGQPPANAVFKAKEGALHGFAKRNDGLYVVKGLTIFVR